MDQLKDELSAACRIVGRLRLTREPNGHISIRIPGTDKILIKARGPLEAPLSFTRPEDLAIVDIDGRLLEGREGLAPPSEVFIHTEVLRQRADIQSVIHIHPANVVAFTIVAKPVLPVIGAYNPSALRLVTEGIPTYPKSVLINTRERGEQLAQTLGDHSLCLLKSHGIVTAGTSIEEATLAAIHINDLAELQLKAATLGEPASIPVDEVEDILGNLPPELRRHSSRAAKGPSSEWRFYLEAFGQ